MAKANVAKAKSKTAKPALAKTPMKTKTVLKAAASKPVAKAAAKLVVTKAKSVKADAKAITTRSITTKSITTKSVATKTAPKGSSDRSVVVKSAKTKVIKAPKLVVKAEAEVSKKTNGRLQIEFPSPPPRKITPSAEAPKDGPSDEAVYAATGKTWTEWFRQLDSVQASKLEHRGVIAAVKKHRVDDWWSQMVATIYGKAKGKGQVAAFKPGPNKPGAAMAELLDGFEIGVSRTLGVAVGIAFDRFAMASLRITWLPESIEISRMTRPRSVRARWRDDSRIDVNFYPKGEAKCQVSLQHGKLETPIAAEAMKEFWGKRLDTLQGILGEG